MVGRGEVV